MSATPRLERRDDGEGRMGFSSEWLALRRAADDRSRDAALLAEAVAATRERAAPLVVDLGCGAGANARVLLDAFEPRDRACLRLRLVDADPGLLALAAAAFPEAETRRIDLAADLERAIEGADLVTASALFDLCSADWIDRFVAALPPRAIVYAALSYDGRERREPQTPADGSVVRAFLRHQRRDKGFGPSLGPTAAAHLGMALAARGYRLRTGESAWRLVRDRDAKLMAALDAGIADAAEEEGADTALWRSAVRERAETGHVDLLALPPTEGAAER